MPLAACLILTLGIAGCSSSDDLDASPVNQETPVDPSTVHDMSSDPNADIQPPDGVPTPSGSPAPGQPGAPGQPRLGSGPEQSGVPAAPTAPAPDAPAKKPSTAQKPPAINVPNAKPISNQQALANSISASLNKAKTARADVQIENKNMVVEFDSMSLTEPKARVSSEGKNYVVSGKSVFVNEGGNWKDASNANLISRIVTLVHPMGIAEAVRSSSTVKKSSNSGARRSAETTYQADFDGTSRAFAVDKSNLVSRATDRGGITVKYSAYGAAPKLPST